MESPSPAFLYAPFSWFVFCAVFYVSFTCAKYFEKSLLSDAESACMIMDSPQSRVSSAAVPLISVCSAWCNRKTAEILCANRSGLPLPVLASASGERGETWAGLGTSWLWSEAAWAAGMARWCQRFCLQTWVHECTHCCALLLGRRGTEARTPAFGNRSGNSVLLDNHNCFSLCVLSKAWVIVWLPRIAWVCWQTECFVVFWEVSFGMESSSLPQPGYSSPFMAPP